MRRLLKFLAIVLVLAGLALVALLAAERTLVAPATLAPRDGPALADVKAWGYQLQRLNPALIPAEIDLLVTDYSQDGSLSGAWTVDQISALRRGPDGRRRIVLAYLSIGEAENYRAYWRAHWGVVAPSWLGPENTEWKGNYAVRYWHPGWQKVIMDPTPSLMQRLGERWLPSMFPRPYLDLILEAGFDGVYLDKIDGFEDWQSERRGAAGEMVDFVSAISQYAKARRPGFLIVPQNGEALLEMPRYLKVIDGIAKEDLQYGANGDGVRNSPEEVIAAAEDLNRAITAGLPVFQVEYLRDPAIRLMIQQEAGRLGYRLLFANRDLNVPPELLPPLPPPPPPPTEPAIVPPPADPLTAPDAGTAAPDPSARAAAPSLAPPATGNAPPRAP